MAAITAHKHACEWTFYADARLFFRCLCIFLQSVYARVRARVCLYGDVNASHFRPVRIVDMGRRRRTRSVR